jgi:hypothetical protein
VVCQRQPSDAHHLKFAQGRALGRKVSDEFTVPVCRDHHDELHRHGDERAWWANLKILPLDRAQELWEASLRAAGVHDVGHEHRFRQPSQPASEAISGRLIAR